MASAAAASTSDLSDLSDLSDSDLSTSDLSTRVCLIVFFSIVHVVSLIFSYVLQMFNRYSAEDLRTPILQSVGGKLAVKNVTQVSARVFCFNDRLLQSFATQKSTSLDCLKRQAKLLKLTSTKSGRSRHKCGRIWFGIGKRARVIVATEGYTTLFRFGLHLDGFYPGT